MVHGSLKIWKFPYFSVATVIDVKQNLLPKITLQLAKNGGFKEILRCEPWTLAKLSQKLFASAFLAASDRLVQKRFFLLDVEGGINISIEPSIERKIVFVLEQLEICVKLYLSPEEAYKLGKILSETAVVSLYKALDMLQEEHETQPPQILPRSIKVIENV